VPLERTLKSKALTLMAGKPVIRHGPQFVVLTGKNLETYNEIERLAQAGESKKAEALIEELGKRMFGPEFDPYA
jgi:hypothetical protein